MFISFMLIISNFNNFCLISLKSPREQGRKFISILQAGKLEGREKRASNGKKPVAGIKSRSIICLGPALTDMEQLNNTVPSKGFRKYSCIYALLVMSASDVRFIFKGMSQLPKTFEQET